MSDKIKKNFWVDPEMSERWEAFAKARDWTMTTLIKEAVHAFIKAESKDDAPSIMKRLEEVASKKADLIAERDAVNAELVEKVTKMEDMLSKMTATATPTEDDKARVVGVISKAWFSLKELTSVLTMPIERVGAVLRELKELGIAQQNDKLKWRTIRATQTVDDQE